ncbi:MAG TPA: hypothetical protein PLP33_24865 [Leptospiraceae bacterium]|nr:hypothetical protein [Leptospiraceae bacterium]
MIDFSAKILGYTLLGFIAMFLVVQFVSITRLNFIAYLKGFKCSCGKLMLRNSYSSNMGNFIASLFGAPIVTYFKCIYCGKIHADHEIKKLF